MTDMSAGTPPEPEVSWPELAEELGGEYEEGPWYHQHLIHVPHRHWTITLDTYVSTTVDQSEHEDHVVYTRVRAPYVTRDRFRLRVHREGFWSKIGKLLGMQDIEVGHGTFDEKFVVKSNREDLVVQFFDDERIRQLLLEHPTIYLEVGDAEGRFRKEHKGPVYEVYHRERGVASDKAYLKALHELFVHALDRLDELESAWEEGPVPLRAALRADQRAAD